MYYVYIVIGSTQVFITWYLHWIFFNEDILHALFICWAYYNYKSLRQLVIDSMWLWVTQTKIIKYIMWSNRIINDE